MLKGSRRSSPVAAFPFSPGWHDLYYNKLTDHSICFHRHTHEAVNLCKTGIADALVKQNSANTGPSIQKGMIQPISGVNEKSEGVCGVCKIKTKKQEEERREQRGRSGKEPLPGGVATFPHRNTTRIFLRRVASTTAALAGIPPHAQGTHPLIPFLSISQSTMCSMGALSSVSGLYLSSYELSLKFNWLYAAML